VTGLGRCIRRWPLVAAAALLFACQVPFLPRKRESVLPERAALLGLAGPVEVAVDSPVYSRNGVIRTGGAATNYTGCALESCTVQLRFVDDNGTPVGAATAYTFAVVEPGDTWTFEAVSTGAPISDRYYTVEIGRVTAMPKQ
jgi:hypothetical protein